ncbi:hypothetical protein M404DRAFT_1004808 [Pisolithus tinctorius Marx 270]|uniref:Uncharacterized protein n=1 Tax=Pisolithus tinctorius Marx 270 TaxID=870435 RepID=A0A0C3JPC6_PISTI|nr:hypothetical protein M404DRAFT_1004808 [Pisolithus tinctorius Marx 270]
MINTSAVPPEERTDSKLVNRDDGTCSLHSSTNGQVEYTLPSSRGIKYRPRDQHRIGTKFTGTHTHMPPSFFQCPYFPLQWG